MNISKNIYEINLNEAINFKNKMSEMK